MPTTGDLFLALFSFVGLRILWNYVQWRCSPLHKLPGPIKSLSFSTFLLGTFRELTRGAFMEPSLRWWTEAGTDTQLIFHSRLFGRQFVTIFDADVVKEVLTAPYGGKRPLYLKKLLYLRRSLGDGLVTLEGSEWKMHRKIIQPSFNNQFLRVALKNCVPGLVQRLATSWKRKAGQDIDVFQHFSAITLDIIGKVCLSYEFRAIESVEEWGQDKSTEVTLEDPLISSLYSILVVDTYRMIMLGLGIHAIEKYVHRRVRHAHKTLSQTVDVVFKNAYANHKKANSSFGAVNENQHSGHDKCMLDYLFDAESMAPGSGKRAFTQHELENEIKTFLIAGHETTSTLCSWACYCLVKYPQIQQRVHDDIMKHASGKDTLELETIEEMTYFSAFLNEVLRMYPPVGMIVRSNAEEIKWHGETIPAHTRLIIPIHLLHRHPKYWTDPLEFQPERWLKENGKDEKFHHFAFLPFSAGGRNCIGQRFALLEVKLIMAPLIRDFEMMLSSSLEGVEIKLSSFVTTKSKPALKICVKPRS